MTHAEFLQDYGTSVDAELTELRGKALYNGDAPSSPELIASNFGLDYLPTGFKLWDFANGLPTEWSSYNYSTGPASHKNTALWQANRLVLNEDGLRIRAYPGTEASDGSRRMVSGGGGMFFSSGSWPSLPSSPTKAEGLSGRFYVAARLRLEPDPEAFMGCVFLLQRTGGDWLDKGEVDIFEVGAGVRDKYTLTVHKSNPSAPSVDVKKQFTVPCDTTRWLTAGAFVDTTEGSVTPVFNGTIWPSIQNDAFTSFGSFVPVIQTEAFRLPSATDSKDASAMQVRWITAYQF